MLGFDAIASLPISSIPADSGNVNISGDAASLVFTGQSGTVSLSVSGDAASLVFTGQDGTVSGGGETRTVGYPKPVRHSVKINGQLITGTYEEIQSLVQQLAEQDAKEAATEVIEQAKQPRRAKFLRVLPAKPQPDTAPEPIQARPLVVEYEQAYQAFLQNLLSQAIATQYMRDREDEEALIMLL